jgi:hypothetical protein
VFLKLGGRQDERIHLDWRKESAVFSWGTGEVKMPAGFTYARETGIDTFMGLFTSETEDWLLSTTSGNWRQNTVGWGTWKR